MKPRARGPARRIVGVGFFDLASGVVEARVADEAPGGLLHVCVRMVRG